MAQLYVLTEDKILNEWQLRKKGEAHCESIFAGLDDAVARLSDAVGPGESVVEILDGSGEVSDTRRICR